MRIITWRWSAGLLLLWLATAVGQASAHPGQPPAPHDLSTAWNWEPLLLAGLAITAAFYARGVVFLRRRSGSGGSASGRKVAAFALGMLAVFVALVSPLDALAGALFSAHMGQHILLMQVAAPLLVLGISPAILAWGAPRAWRRPLLSGGHSLAWVHTSWKALSHPLVAWALHTLALWIWHTPRLYEAALVDERLHVLEHLSFLGSGLLYWWTVFQPKGLDRELGVRLLSVFTMAMQSGLLGALLTFAPLPWYAGQSAGAAAWGLTALEDQQLAGVLMWAPGGLVYLISAVWMLGARLTAMERDDLAAGQIIENEL